MLVVADEPTGSLDKDTEAKVLEIFKLLALKDGKCVIIVTHSENVTAIADEIWSLDEGIFQRR
jgi:putative ABC transport system ATP-binding protein